MIRPWVLATAALGLFAVWSNSFIAIGYLLGGERAEARFDWRGLTVARFVTASVVCGGYCLVARRRESVALIRRQWPRLILCGLLVVPGYNFSLYFGQQHGVPAPIASLTTALVPLFVMMLAAAFLGESLTARRVVGFGVAMVGMVLVATAKESAAVVGSYAALVAVTALAPLSWSIYSVVSKPMVGEASPIVWTYLATSTGALATVPLLPATWADWAALDVRGWAALAYLAVPCTVLGFAVWTWLLRHMPASAVGFTVFFNPPLTTLSKYLLAAALPAAFLFDVRAQEWLGGGLALLGMAIALRRRRTPRRHSPDAAPSPHLGRAE